MQKLYLRSNRQIGVRPMTSADTDALYSVVMQSLTSLSTWMPWCKLDYSQEDALNWTSHCDHAWNANTEFPLGIFEITSGQLVGSSGINQINRAYSSGNIGYWVGTPFLGRGYATTAALMAADFAFSELGLTRTEFVVLLENAASLRVAENCGATKEGMARNRLYSHGRPADAVVYSLIPQDLLTNERVRQFNRFLAD